MPAKTPPPQRQRRKEARPSELSAAALELFVAKGFSATRLDEIAARAGVSKGTLYLYFDSKEALFQAVIREGMLPILDEAEAYAVRHQGSSFELLSFILLGWWENIGTTRLSGIPKLIVAEAQNFPEVATYYYENVIRRGRALIAAALEKGMQRGEFRQLDVDTCIDVVIGPMLTLLVWRRAMAHCLENAPDARSILQAHLEILKHGLVTV